MEYDPETGTSTSNGPTRRLKDTEVRSKDLEKRLADLERRVQLLEENRR